MSETNQTVRRGHFNKKILLKTGALNKLYLWGNPTHIVPATVFAFDSAFPGPGIAIHLKTIQEIIEENENMRLVVFGHADYKGSLEYNKKLSERRARGVLALMTGDLEMFDAVEAEDTWDLHQYQAMMRAVGCNPGAIDGTNGDMTKAAVRCFQEEYNADVFHKDALLRAHPNLTVDGLLGPRTEAAIRDAYISIFSVSIPQSVFAGPRYAGCSEFNLVWPTDEENRRVIIALFEKSNPADMEFPCKRGNISACPVKKSEKVQCNFYRNYIIEMEEERPQDMFYDFQWLAEESGAIHLSAITTIPDETSAKFTVFRCEGPVPMPPPDSFDGGSPPDVGPEIGSAQGKVMGGIAFARWQPPSDYDPFDYTDWLVDHDIDLRAYSGDEEVPDDDPATGEELMKLDGMHPPLFRIDAGGEWGYSTPPGQRLNRIFFVDEETEYGIAIRNNGSVVRYAAHSGIIEEDDDIDIISIFASGKNIETGEGEESEGEAE
jgi:hypothetical protein